MKYESLKRQTTFFAVLLMTAVNFRKKPSLKIDYIIAPPRMARYMEYSTKIYNIYLKYIAPEDIHIYSIDEVFIDVTHYLSTYNMTARELCNDNDTRYFRYNRNNRNSRNRNKSVSLQNSNGYSRKNTLNRIKTVYESPNSTKCHTEDCYGITDLLLIFWRVGRGYSKKLEKIGLYTMGDIARCSIGKPTDYYNEELLYKLFGINAELLIDHAWGYEPCTMEDVKTYKPETNSISSGQVLHCPYEFDKARLVVKEMTDLMVLDLVNKGLVTNQIVLTIGYDIENITDKNRSQSYKGTVTTNYYGKKVPKPAHGTTNLPKQTSSTTLITNAVMELYDKIVNKKLLIRRINIVANKLVDEHSVKNANKYEQLDLFTDYEILKKQREKENAESEREKTYAEYNT